MPVASIGDAAKRLRDIQRNWAMYAPLHHRRAALIQERLPHVSAKPVVFPRRRRPRRSAPGPCSAPDRLLAAAHCSSPFPNGEVRFVEDKAGPPNRAYLKLWEALIRARPLAAAGRALPRSRRQPGRLDLGRWRARAPASSASTRRRSIRGSPRCRACECARRERLRARPGERRAGRLAVLRHRLLSGAALRLVERWLASGLVQNFVCTHQVPGRDRPRGRAPFAAIPGAAVLHLHHNKHELTFLLSE